jgi:RNA polymerase sigma-70 factor (ECF subfamily)
VTGSGTPASEAAAVFDPLRPRLLRIAYRMLGSVADAEDIVQEAFIRWQGSDRAAVRVPEAFLRRVVTRLCLDELKSARARRETYVGPWLPEPLVETEEDEADDVTLPLMMALERLSPLERAAFLLHDVFDVAFAEVAETIGRDEASCRQLAKRARDHLKAARPRYRLPKEHGLEIAEAFFTASHDGDMAALQALLADDIAVYADGGGKRPAALVPLFGIDRAMALFKRIARILAEAPRPRPSFRIIDGLPGYVTVEADGVPQTTAFDIRDGRIAAIYIVRNPDKLRHLDKGMLQ